MALSQERYNQELINNFVKATAWDDLQSMVECLRKGPAWEGQHSVDGRTAFFWINSKQDIEKFQYLYAIVLAKKESEKLYREITCNDYAWLMEQIIITEKQVIPAGERLLSMAALHGSIGVVEVLCRNNIGINDYIPMNDQEKLIPHAVRNPGRAIEGGVPIEDEAQIEGEGEVSIDMKDEIQIEGWQAPSALLVLQIAYRAMRLHSFPLLCEQSALLVNIHENPIYFDVIRVSHVESIVSRALQKLSYYETLLKLLTILANANVDFTLTDRYGNTMLHYLARHCYATNQTERKYYVNLIERVATQNGNNIRAINNNGDTALDVAIRFNNQYAAATLANANGVRAR